MRRKTRSLCLPAVVFATGLFAFSGDAVAESTEVDNEATRDEPTDQIVVVAHKDERPLREIAANVTTLSRETLTDNLATSIADIFRYVPGVDYEAAGTRFGTEGISIRGIGGNRVAMLVDGVPLSDQFDVGSFSNATRDFIDAGLVQGIEVLHGPASALYGSSAIGGVVAVRTPDPSDLIGRGRHGGDVLATWRGADQSFNGQAMAAFGSSSLGVLAGYSRRGGEERDAAAAPDGVDTRDSDRQTVLLKLVADNRWGQTLKASYIHQDSEVLSDLNSMLGQGRYRSTTALKGDDRYDMDMINTSWEFGSPEGFVDAGVLRAYFETADVSQYTLDERGAARTPVSIDRYFSFEQKIHGIELNLWKELTGAYITHRLGLGVEYRERRTEEYRDGLQTTLTSGAQTKVLLGEQFPLRDFPISKTRDMAAFVEDTMSFGAWTLIAAVRADRFELQPENDPMYLEDYPFADPVSLDESDLSPKLGLIYNFANGTDIYAQYSHGFRAPPFADANISLEIPFFNYRAIPNPDLKSESSDGIELGLRWSGYRSRAHVSVFQTRYDNFIESKVRLGVDPDSGRTLFQSQNIRETAIEGVEAGASLRLSGAFEQFSVDGSFYIARGENKQSGEPLNSVGPAQAVVGVTWRSQSERRQLRLNSTLTEAWDDRDESRGDLFKPPGNAIFDLFLTQHIGNNAAIRLGVHNLTDRTWWHWSDVRGVAPDDPILPYLSQAGRSASLSLNVTW